MSINDWKIDDRPRERMYVSGAASLSDSELLAILINSGTRNKSAVEVCRDLLAQAGNSLNSLSQMSIDRLQSIHGIGAAKAARLKAMFELAARIQNETHDQGSAITSSKAVAGIFSPMLRNLQHEECWALFLNRANRIIGKERISTGGVSATVMDARVVIHKAVDKLASGIILVHNHPSGNPVPSELDKKQTQLLKEAASLLDVTLMDHIIIAGNRYYSFCDEGL
ncbi:MAG TPA: DNA repair protein RadC [Candidatus Coprenecus stercoravium]|uniref:DNA repair protein RadC n=1 Tax=Candidatus Coprenecus stercoravium TaxID=2840735 RepID=A0A9D2KAL7_9BACT|nr:DNA repair protein RadC [Candidatus Coprenecus stercoravium]